MAIMVRPVPRRCSAARVRTLRRAVREFAKNNLLVAAWNLPPLNVREIRTPDISQPLTQASEPALAALLGLSRPATDQPSSANAE